ncbi:MAG: PTS sugar transporter subunit IIA [Bacillota bacterium]
MLRPVGIERQPEPPWSLAAALSPGRIVIWDDPVSTQELLSRLVDAVRADQPGLDVSSVVAQLEDREWQGSTFLNEGVALPHARIAGLQSTQVALGITQAGVLDVPTDNPIEVAFMLLSPTEHAASHLRLLANASRILQSRELRRRLAQVTAPDEALATIREYEFSIRRQ